jgi:hypothetical protein
MKLRQKNLRKDFPIFSSSFFGSVSSANGQVPR